VSRPPAGRAVVRYEPSPRDLRNAAGWRGERTLAAAWRRYRAFATSPRWAADCDLPTYDVGYPDYGYERLMLRARHDARIVLVCEKPVVLEAADAWSSPKRPSVAHATRAALAWIPPLPSAWACKTLRDHAKGLRAPLAFFGDLDPQAIHLFAALRAGGRDAVTKPRAPRGPVRWIGLDEQWLDMACRQRGVREVPRAWTIELRWLDREYWELVKRMVPDVHRLVGARGCALLDRGLKVEADALVVWMREAFVRELARRLRQARG
jgi:hypothetical protein